MTLRVALEQEEDGRWIADIIELPGVMVYGGTPKPECWRLRCECWSTDAIITD